jgi:excisionase family DNA binding protein
MAGEEVGMEEQHLSLSEAAHRLDISERTTRRWIKSGKLRAFKPGRDYRIPESAISEVIKRSEAYPKAQAPLPLSDVAGAELLERALDAARQDMKRESQAVNRLHASDGVPQNITAFAEDEVRRELLTAGFPDEHFEGVFWPLVVRLARVEQENAQLREEVGAEARV